MPRLMSLLWLLSFLQALKSRCNSSIVTELFSHIVTWIIEKEKKTLVDDYCLLVVD